MILKWTFWLLFAFSSLANGATEIRFAGIGFVGNAADSKKRLPVLTRILSEETLIELNQRLFQLLQNAAIDDLKITTDLGNTNSGEALALALALENEQLVLNKFDSAVSGQGGKTALFAQLLVFNLTQKRLLTVVPLYAQKANFQSGVWSEEVGEQWITELLYQDANDSLFAQFVARVKILELNQSWGANIRVGRVDIAEPALAALNEYGIDEGDYQRWLASIFSAELSSTLGIPVLPYSKGQAIAAAIPLRFANAEAVNFALPPADFEIDLTARGYVLKTIEESSSTATLAHIVGFGASISDVAFKKEHLRLPFQLSRTQRYNKSTQVDHWAIFEELAAIATKSFVVQMQSPDPKWIKDFVPGKSTRDVKQQVEAVNKYVFNEIRGI